MIGTLFSAFGIVLEGIGLLYYIRLRPSVKQLIDTELHSHSWTYIIPDRVIQKWRTEDNIIQFLIGLGLFLQLMALFV